MPSHIGVKGNDKADMLVSLGREQVEIDRDVGLDKKELRKKIDNFVSDNIQQPLWDARKNTLFKELNPEIGISRPYGPNKKNITRMRMEVPDFHVRRDRSCKKCKQFLSMQHALMHCQHFTREREALKVALRKEGKSLTIFNILDFNASESIKPLASYLLDQIDKVFHV